MGLLAAGMHAQGGGLTPSQPSASVPTWQVTPKRTAHVSHVWTGPTSWPSTKQTAAAAPEPMNAVHSACCWQGTLHVVAGRSSQWRGSAPTWTHASSPSPHGTAVTPETHTMGYVGQSTHGCGCEADGDAG